MSWTETRGCQNLMALATAKALLIKSSGVMERSLTDKMSKECRDMAEKHSGLLSALERPKENATLHGYRNFTPVSLFKTSTCLF